MSTLSNYFLLIATTLGIVFGGAYSVKLYKMIKYKIEMTQAERDRKAMIKLYNKTSNPEILDCLITMKECDIKQLKKLQ